MKLPKDLEPYLQDFDYGNPYFIEAIVRDCAKVCDANLVHGMKSAHFLAVEEGARRCRDAILSRYGLEPK